MNARYHLLLFFILSIGILTAQPQNDLCENASILPIGGQLSGTLKDATLPTETYFIDCQYYSSEDFDVWYSVPDHYGPVSLIVESQRSLRVQVFSGICDDLLCTDLTRLEDSIVFFMEEDLNYYVQVSNYSSQDTVDFNIRINLLQKLLNDYCSNAIQVEVGDTLMGSNLNAGPDSLQGFSCTPNYTRGQWYSFLGNGKNYSLAVLDGYIDYNVSLFVGDCENLQCLLQQPLSFQSNESNSFYVDKGVIVYLFIMSNENYYFDQSFKLQLNSYDIAHNINCENAILLSDTIRSSTRSSVDGRFWFYLEGDDMGHILKDLGNGTKDIQVYSGDCNLLQLEREFSLRYSSIRFFAEKPKNYLISISRRTDGDILVMHDVFQPAVNNFCQGAIPLICDQVVFENFTTATHSIVEGCSNSENLDLWYTMVGDGMIHYFEPTEGYFNIQIMEGNCGDVTCLKEISGSDNYYVSTRSTFFAELGKTYFININQSQVGNIVFRNRCYNPLGNSFCDEAEDLVAGRSYQLDFSFAGTTDTVPCTDKNRGVWYRYIGDDKVLKLHGQTSFMTYVFRGDCNNLICHAYSDNDGSKFKFLAGEVYYLYIADYYNDRISFNTSAVDISEGDECSEAISLTCLDTMDGDFLSVTSDTLGQQCIDQPLFWYSVKGDGLFHVFRSLLPTGVYVNVFLGECNEDMECIDRSYVSTYDSSYFYAALGQDYLIAVSSAYSNDLPFKVLHICIEPVVNSICESALVVGSDTTIRFSGINTLDNNWTSNCRVFQADLWYKFTGNGNFQIIRSTQRNFRLFTGDCSELLCFDFSNPISYREFQAELGVDYYIAIYSGRHEFELTLENLPIVENDNFDNAISIDCGEVATGSFTGALPDEIPCIYTNGKGGIWYSFHAESDISTLEVADLSSFNVLFAYFEATDDGYICEYKSLYRLYGGDFSFATKPGQKYILYFYEDRTSDNPSLSFKIDCDIAQTGELCKDPILISCDNDINLHFERNSIGNFECDNGGSNVGLWYLIKGEGKRTTITLSHHISGSYPSLAIYDNGCYGQCFMNNDFNLYENNTIEFYFEKNTDYLLRFWAIQGSQSTISISCSDVVKGDICQKAIPIFCGDTFVVSTDDMTYDALGYCDANVSYTPGVWYKVAGTDYQTITARLLGNYFQEVIVVNDCKATDCQFRQTYTGNFNFPASPGDTSFILIRKDPYQADPSITLECAVPAVTPCAPVNVLSGLSLPDEDYPSGRIRAKNEIIVDNTSINFGASYLWQAGESINITENFTVYPNTVLEIKVQDCKDGEIK